MNITILESKKEFSRFFITKGIFIAIFSGFIYGLYTAFIILGTTTGVWENKFKIETVLLSFFANACIFGALGSAVNDTCSAIWALIFLGIKGKYIDLLGCVNSKPGKVMIIAALIGGPIASTAFVVSLQLAGPIAIPISALCPAIGAILGHLFFKQFLNKRMTLGITICVVASFIIGITNLGGNEKYPNMLLGIFIMLIAALGWAFEGSVAGFGTSLIDSEIGITIRQITSAISNIFILLPILGFIFAKISLTTSFITQALFNGSSMIYFMISGLCSYFSFMFWYRGNSMCGAALGMACNGTYAFWGPLCCYVIIGLFAKKTGYTISWVDWVSAISIAFGILIIAKNPFNFLKNEKNKEKLPLNYAILNHFLHVDMACANDVIKSLNNNYSWFKALKKESVINALMTAEVNGLLVESEFDIDELNQLRIYYRVSEYGKNMIKKFIKN